MNVIQSILTKNPCFQVGRTISVKGLMLHSVGCAQPNAAVFLSAWNSANYSSACVHAFIDGNTGDVYQTLPWNMRGWHAGTPANDSYIGVEMCEPPPSALKYTNNGTSLDILDAAAARAVVQRTYRSVVELFASLCRQFQLDPLRDGVILSHKEGALRGIATAHGDPEHLWCKFGLTMDQFRKDVDAALKAQQQQQEAADMSGEEIYNRLNEYMGNRKLTWAIEEFQEAVQMGITDGKNPRGLITKQEVAVMLLKALQNLDRFQRSE